MNASPAKQIKAKLKKFFPNVKFSVTTPSTRTHPATGVYVDWDMGIGSNITWDAVKSVTDEFNNTYERENSNEPRYQHVKLYYKVELCPKFSKERKDWTLECIKQLPLDGEEKYDEIKRYNNYLRNGVCSNIL